VLKLCLRNGADIVYRISSCGSAERKRGRLALLPLYTQMFRD
jgi:hypothetical protein